MASMDKLANSMGYVGPVANSLGYTIEETVGALSVLYDAGYDGSTAGTSLRQAFVSLMNPSKTNTWLWASRLEKRSPRAKN